MYEEGWARLKALVFLKYYCRSDDFKAT